MNPVHEGVHRVVINPLDLELSVITVSHHESVGNGQYVVYLSFVLGLLHDHLSGPQLCWFATKASVR